MPLRLVFHAGANSATTGTTTQSTIPAASMVSNSIILAIHAGDRGTAAQMNLPTNTGPVLSWSTIATADAGDTLTHAKIHAAYLTTGGTATTISATTGVAMGTTLTLMVFTRQTVSSLVSDWVGSARSVTSEFSTVGQAGSTLLQYLWLGAPRDTVAVYGWSHRPVTTIVSSSPAEFVVARHFGGSQMRGGMGYIASPAGGGTPTSGIVRNPASYLAMASVLVLGDRYVTPASSLTTHFPD